MGDGVPMVELWRGGLLESLHRGHAVVAGPEGARAVWGDAGTVVFPRSSCKMIQALPLVESGAAEAAGLGPEELALACASHSGEPRHVARVAGWLAGLGLGEGDLRCGAHPPMAEPARDDLIRAGRAPCQLHNNCSGKHAGFLTLARHLGAGPDYVAIDHPVQARVAEAFQEVTGEPSPGWGIDGCSAPNFATTLAGLARAMAAFAVATAGQGSGARPRAMGRLTRAMMAHPGLVAGEGRACTELMAALAGRGAVKTGAEGVFVAILPGEGLGVAVKVVDGAGRAAEAAIAGLLVHLGLLEPGDPAVQRRIAARQINRRGLDTGVLRLAAGFPGR